ncbi:hypothetical protein GCM10008018_25300 [Paenibacillus marchantiophytorum]|uniref:Inhibitor I9 domain-containing protein n=1 Tax=Paenibacillus marchantiophytorum TaxID=1619310 RepID=A0ABQ1EMS1_9BACL|nr:protease inhibitor I9 family protein [Paenibacillus marchantiophytorum]GFZ78719.1 hypothetical protein GCM10008018_25300 [Paenibacillus marchantiophytorum]
MKISRTKKIALMVAATFVIGGSYSTLGFTKPIEAQSNAQGVNILPFKISEQLAKKIDTASGSDKFPCLVTFDKHLDEQSYANLEKQIGKFSKKQVYETVLEGFAGDLSKEQILLLNNTSFVSHIELDTEVSLGKDIVVTSDFSKNTDGWNGGFSDYPDKDKSIYKLNFSHRLLPKEINNKQKGLYISGVNRSDDLFMFVKKKLDKKEKLQPNTTYSVTFDFDIATNAGKDGMGAGGSPGESVYVKVGATSKEPLAVKDKTGFFWMNIDKGNQSAEGKNAFMIGNLAKTTTDHGKYELKPFDNKQRPFTVKTDDKAELWLLIGTDSAFESGTSIYIPRVNVTLKEVGEWTAAAE